MGLCVRKATLTNFTVLIEKFTPTRHYITLDPKDYHTFGINSKMTVEEADKAAKTFAKKKKLEKRKHVNSFLRVADINSSNEVYLPTNLITQFEAALAKRYFSNPDRLETIQQHWRAAQKVIIAVEALPLAFFDKQNDIYAYFHMKLWSPDYIKRVTKILNQWLDFYARTEKIYCEKLPRIEESLKQDILDAREDKTDVRRPAAPLSFNKLLAVEETFKTKGFLRTGAGYSSVVLLGYARLKLIS